MRSVVFGIPVVSILLAGCAGPAAFVPSTISSVTPSATGIPNSVIAYGSEEFVSVQATGQIFSYNLNGGEQTPVGAPYTTPCSYPNGMAATSINGTNVLVVACYDTGSLLTLTIHADGSLSALGSVSGLPMPYPGILLDGTNVLVPLFGGSSANGAVAKVSIASPAAPVIESTVTLVSPVSGGIANAEYLALANGDIFVTSGSESNPLGASSTIQVVNEATMTLVGSPFTVAHSPQEIAIQGNVAYVTIYDAAELESIDISNPASLQPLETVALSTASQTCHPLPVAVEGSFAYVGCYEEGTIERLNVSNPSQIGAAVELEGIGFPQRLEFAGSTLLATGATVGGKVYQVDVSAF